MFMDKFGSVVAGRMQVCAEMWWEYAIMIQSASWRSNLLGSRPPTTDENVDSLKIMMALWYSMANESLEDTFRPNIGYCMTVCLSFPFQAWCWRVCSNKMGVKRMAPIRSVSPTFQKHQKKSFGPYPRRNLIFFWCYCSCTKSGTSV